jgi:hypothetical protein
MHIRSDSFGIFVAEMTESGKESTGGGRLLLFGPWLGLCVPRAHAASETAWFT